MSFPQKRPHPGRRVWIDEACSRKSRNCAGLATSGLLLALSLAVLIPMRPPVSNAPRGSLPLTLELRRFEPTPAPEPAPRRENRKLLSEQPLPESPRLPEPPKVAPAEIIPPRPAPPATQPAPSPRPEAAPKAKLKKNPAKTLHKMQAEPEQARGKTVAATLQGTRTEALGTAAPAPEPGHASGVETARADRTGEILAALLHAVEARKQYPKQALRQGAEGSVTLRVRLDDRGVIAGCALASESGKGVLDAAARKLGEKLVGLEIPAARGRAVEILVPMQYVLKP